MDNGKTVLDEGFGAGCVDDRFNEIGGVGFFAGVETEIFEEGDFDIVGNEDFGACGSGGICVGGRGSISGTGSIGKSSSIGRSGSIANGRQRVKTDFGFIFELGEFFGEELSQRVRYGRERKGWIGRAVGATEMRD